MSSIGKPDRQLWYEHNLPPEDREQFRAENYMKFLYGHILEEVLIFLLEEAGNKVEGRQEEVEIEGIKGHRDLILNGVQTDIKTASPFAFTKFKDNKLKEPGADPFGYIIQNESYLEASIDDPRITDKDNIAFLVVDKSMGNMTLDVYEKDKDNNIRELYKHKKEVIGLKEPPERCYPTVPDGYKNKDKEFIPNGNEKLGTNCSYCAFKFKCYPELRVFLSSKGPVYFPKVVKEPKMTEITKEEI